MKNLLLTVNLCVTSILIGCGDTASGPEPTYEVSGAITFQGKPVAGADVTFFNAEKKRSAFGRTNDKGEYQLTTFSSNDGAVEGKSTVTVVKFVPAEPVAPEADVESEDYQPPGFGKSTAPPKPKSEIPSKYSDQATSDLMAMVATDRVNKIDFELSE